MSYWAFALLRCGENDVNGVNEVLVLRLKLHLVIVSIHVLYCIVLYCINHVISYCMRIAAGD